MVEIIDKVKTKSLTCINPQFLSMDYVTTSFNEGWGSQTWVLACRNGAATCGAFPSGSSSISIVGVIADAIGGLRRAGGSFDCGFGGTAS